MPYSRPKRSDLYTLSQSKLLENHTLQRGTYLYSPYMAVPPSPVTNVIVHHFRSEKGTEAEMRPQLFLGLLLGTRRTAIRHFSPPPRDTPRSLCEI